MCNLHSALQKFFLDFAPSSNLLHQSGNTAVMLLLLQFLSHLGKFACVMMYRSFPLQQKESSLLPAARIMFGTVTIRLLFPDAAFSLERETCLSHKKKEEYEMAPQKTLVTFRFHLQQFTEN